MFKRIAVLAASFLLALGLGAARPATAAAPDWAGLSNAALAKFAAADDGHLLAFWYAYAAQAEADLNGWGADAAQGYLVKVRAQKMYNADGSFYGYPPYLGNTTPYTITLADHIGPVMLDAYLHGGTPRQDVQEIIDVLMHAYVWVTTGKCVSYRPYQASTDCVHNINSAVALFLLHCLDAGFTIPGAMELINSIIRREAVAFNTTTNLWPYSDTQKAQQDYDHSGLSAEAAMELYPPIGRSTVAKIMTTNFPAGEVSGPLGHLRAGATAYGHNWVDNWYAEAVNYLATTTEGPVRYAQVARWASKIAVG